MVHFIVTVAAEQALEEEEEKQAQAMSHRKQVCEQDKTELKVEGVSYFWSYYYQVSKWVVVEIKLGDIAVMQM